ncbi:hypothetical protein, partial [Rothia nasimurium]
MADKMSNSGKPFIDRLKQDIIPAGVEQIKKGTDALNTATSKINPTSTNQPPLSGEFSKGDFTKKSEYTVGAYGAKIESENPYHNAEPVAGTFPQGHFSQQSNSYAAAAGAAFQAMPENLRQKKGLFGCLGCLGCLGILFVALLVISLIGAMLSPASDKEENPASPSSSATATATPSPTPSP